MLLCGIIKDFENDCNPQEKFAYFFCQGTDTRLNTATAIIKGLIYSVLRHNHKLLSSVQKQTEKEPKGFLEGNNAWVALSRIFTTIIQDPCMADFTFIIDALDECQHHESRKSLLNLIMDTSNHVKWLVTSRNEKEIEHGLKSIENRLILELTSNAAHISNAVDTYIDRCARDIAALEDDKDLRIKIIDLLKTKANGTFLWVTLVVQQLRDAGRPHIERILEEMPEDLESLYDEIMERSKKGWKYEEEACLAFLATVTAAERPLHIDELYIFTSSQLTGAKVRYLPKDIEYLAKVCGSFITITDNTIYLIHQSVKDYMVHKGARSIFPRGVGHQHYKMFEISLNIMDKTLRNNIYNIKSPGKHVDDITPPNPNPLASKAKLFEATQCPEWIVTKPTTRPFWSPCIQTIENVGVYVYSVAISPDTTMLAMAGITGVAEVWDLISGACLHTFGSGYLTKVAFSPNSSQLALVNKDKAEIWDLITGTRLKSIDGNFRSVSFSVDGTHLALLGEDIITIHDLVASVDIQIHTSNPDETFLAVIFPSDCAQLESGSGDGTTGPPSTGTEADPSVLTDQASHATLVVSIQEGSAIKVLDLAKGKCVQNIARNVDMGSMAVSLSSDGRRLAVTAALRGTVDIWDLATGKCLQTLRGRDALVGSELVIVLSPDGLRLALTNGFDIKIWDIATGTCLNTLSGHRSTIYSLVYSPDGLQLVSGDMNGTVKVWDLAANSSPLPLESYLSCQDRINLMTFSPDGRWVAIASADETVRIWNTAARTFLWTMKMPDYPLAMVFSRDSMQLAMSGFEDIITLWDVATGARLRTLPGHARAVVSIAFSPSDTQLASAYFGGNLHIWDLTTGACLHTIEVDCDIDFHTTIAFSPGGTQLGFVSREGTVKTWDLFTGICLQTIENCLDPKKRKPCIGKPGLKERAGWSRWRLFTEGGQSSPPRAGQFWIAQVALQLQKD
ncbi:hypothetical protein ACSS6W_010395 [Trichoderma asperelloides]